MNVFVTSYEVNTAGLPLIAEYNEADIAWRKAAWAIVQEFDGQGFQPGWNGVRAILFKDSAPVGWRVLERDPRNREMVRCAPRKSTKAGKAAAERLAAVGMRPRGEDAAKLFDWNPAEMAMDGTTIYFPTAQTIELPTPRHFLRLPRFPSDNWPGHPGLTEIPESEYMRAIEAHNAVLREQRSRDTDGSPTGTDPKGLDGVAATAGADEGGIAQGTPS